MYRLDLYDVTRVQRHRDIKLKPASNLSQSLHEHRSKITNIRCVTWISSSLETVYYGWGAFYQLDLLLKLMLFLSCLLCFHARLFVNALWSPAGKGLTSSLSFVVSNCDVVTFPLVFWVRCGAWLYRFLIFALFLTSMKGWLYKI